MEKSVKNKGLELALCTVAGFYLSAWFLGTHISDTVIMLVFIASYLMGRDWK
jgi:hypothetical protein